MKALSVKNPWDFLLLLGQKTIEVRSWSTNYRGALLICASASPKNFFWHDPEEDKNMLLPAGCLMGVVELVDVRKLTEADSEQSLCDYEPSAYAWVIDDIAFVKPEKVIGKLKLFEVDNELITIIPNESDDWIFNYPAPQGDIKYTDRCDRWA